MRVEYTPDSDYDYFMCGRFSQTKKVTEAEERFKAQLSLEMKDQPFQTYNASPGQGLAVILDQKPKLIQKLTWGLIPFWANDTKIGYKTINAMAETVDQKPSFRTSFKKQRCLVIADGFYEWANTRQGKIPVYIGLKNNSLFAFAGLWSEWTNKETKEIIRSFTIITTPANEKLKPIYPRMPVILSEKDEKIWLDSLIDPKELKSLLQPYPEKEMDFYAVSTRVNSPKNNDPTIIKPVDTDIKSLLYVT